VDVIDVSIKMSERCRHTLLVRLDGECLDSENRAAFMAVVQDHHPFEIKYCGNGETTPRLDVHSIEGDLSLVGADKIEEYLGIRCGDWITN